MSVFNLSIRLLLTYHDSAAYLRQSILLSAFETPETRSLFNSNLKNVAGKIRTEKRWNPIEVPDGIDQVSHVVSEFVVSVPYASW